MTGQRVGWIGAGRMGQAMARRLLAGGVDVAVWNRTRAKAEALSEAGAVVADRVGDLAGRDIVFTTVAADADLIEVTLGDGGLLRQEEVAPAFLVDSSTVSAETSDRVRRAAAERGTTLLAAPVSGNAKVVRAGKLSIAVSRCRCPSRPPRTSGSRRRSAAATGPRTSPRCWWRRAATPGSSRARRTPRSTTACIKPPTGPRAAARSQQIHSLFPGLSPATRAIV